MATQTAAKKAYWKIGFGNAASTITGILSLGLSYLALGAFYQPALISAIPFVGANLLALATTTITIPGLAVALPILPILMIGLASARIAASALTNKDKKQRGALAINAGMVAASAAVFGSTLVGFTFAPLLAAGIVATGIALSFRSMVLAARKGSISSTLFASLGFVASALSGVAMTSTIIHQVQNPDSNLGKLYAQGAETYNKDVQPAIDTFWKNLLSLSPSSPEQSAVPADPASATSAPAASTTTGDGAVTATAPTEATAPDASSTAATATAETGKSTAIIVKHPDGTITATMEATAGGEDVTVVLTAPKDGLFTTAQILYPSNTDLNAPANQQNVSVVYVTSSNDISIVTTLPTDNGGTVQVIINYDSQGNVTSSQVNGGLNYGTNYGPATQEQIDAALDKVASLGSVEIKPQATVADGPLAQEMRARALGSPQPA